MAEKKSQTVKKPTSSRTSAQKTGKSRPQKKVTSSVSPAGTKRRIVTPRIKPATQSSIWHSTFAHIQEWLQDWWIFGLQQQEPEPEQKVRKKKTIRLQTAGPQPKRSRSVRTSASGVHLIGKEKHRCPYCLEIVTKNDPRGVRICPICHTYHHADCWAETGTCQVPHYHA